MSRQFQRKAKLGRVAKHCHWKPSISLNSSAQHQSYRTGHSSNVWPFYRSKRTHTLMHINSNRHGSPQIRFLWWAQVSKNGRKYRILSSCWSLPEHLLTIRFYTKDDQDHVSILLVSISIILWCFTTVAIVFANAPFH